MTVTSKLKKYVLPNLPYAFVFWFANKLGEAVRIAPGADFLQKITGSMKTLGIAMENPMPSFHPIDLLVGLCGAVLIYAIVYFKGKNAKKYRKNTEYGSARWGTSADIKPYVDPKPENNIILTAAESLTMNSRPQSPKYARNKNVLVVGGSGSGKTRFWVKPNLMQCQSKDYPVSFVVTDPKGTLLTDCGHLLQKSGYRIKVLNTINFKKSMHYNPFAYINSEKDILKLISTLIANTKGEGNKSGEDFWIKAETLLYTALIGYIHYEAPEGERNMNTLVEFINSMEVREDDESFKNAVDLMFDALAEYKPDHFAVRQYAKFKLAAGKTSKSILVSCGARLAPFDIQELRDIMAYDEMDLDTLGDRRTAMFIVTSDSDGTFDFITAMICTQLFNTLLTKADDVYGGRLPIHVRCLFDEAANIKIPMLERLMAVCRSREVSVALMIQAQSQLKAQYKDNAETIIGNCDSAIFLGGKEKTTLEEWSKLLGKETIDMYNTNITKGNQESHGQNFQKLGKDLMSVDELAVMDGGKCVLQLRGVRPFLSAKYDITQHPNYKHLADANKRNAFDIERFLGTRLKVKPDDIYEVYELNLTDDMTGARLD